MEQQQPSVILFIHVGDRTQMEWISAQGLSLNVYLAFYFSQNDIQVQRWNFHKLSIVSSITCISIFEVQKNSVFSIKKERKEEENVFPLTPTAPELTEKSLMPWWKVTAVVPGAACVHGARWNEADSSGVQITMEMCFPVRVRPFRIINLKQTYDKKVVWTM